MIRLRDIDTNTILHELKLRYKNEPAIRDYIEMIECEVMAIEREKR